MHLSYRPFITQLPANRPDSPAIVEWSVVVAVEAERP